MKSSSIPVHVRVNARIFRRFAFFDTFKLKKRWRAPAVFAAIFLICSIICFIHPDREQGARLGNVLLILGVGLPIAYVAHFYMQIQDQIKRLGLKNLRPAYTLNLEDNQLRVINDMHQQPEISLKWDSLYGVWRSEFAFYVYAVPSRAFIIPDGQYSPSPAELYDFFKAHLPEGNLHGKRP